MVEKKAPLSLPPSIINTKLLPIPSTTPAFPPLPSLPSPFPFVKQERNSSLKPPKLMASSRYCNATSTKRCVFLPRTTLDISITPAIITLIEPHNNMIYWPHFETPLIFAVHDSYLMSALFFLVSFFYSIPYFFIFTFFS